jgi:cytochrome c oxidase subunit 3
MSDPEAPRNEEFMFHPRQVMLYILLLGLSMLFLSLTMGYLYARFTMNVPPVQVPPLFFVNTVVLLASSFTMIRAKRCYLNDDTTGYQRNLQYTLLHSLLFIGLQTVAWVLLFRSNIALNSSTTAAYLYVISFVHLAHVVAGLPFLYLFYRAAKKHMVDPVTVLVYFSDPEKRLRLRLLTLYWHFLDILWVYLVIFFTINLLLRS